MRYLVAGLVVLAISLTIFAQEDPFAEPDKPSGANPFSEKVDPFAGPPTDNGSKTDEREAKGRAAQRDSGRKPRRERDIRVATVAAKKLAPIKAAMTKRASCDFFEQPLKDAMDSLGEEQGIQFHFDADAMENVGIAPDQTIVTIEFRDIPLRSLITHMLRPYDLSFVILEEDELVLITSVEESEAHLVTEIYTVRNLLSKDDPNRSVDLLIDTIMGTVAPDSWEELGGSGSICHYQGILVVSTTSEIQHRVDTLLKRLTTAIDAAGGPVLAVTSPKAKKIPGGGFGGGGGNPGGVNTAKGRRSVDR